MLKYYTEELVASFPLHIQSRVTHRTVCIYVLDRQWPGLAWYGSLHSNLLSVISFFSTGFWFLFRVTDICRGLGVGMALLFRFLLINVSLLAWRMEERVCDYPN